MIVIVNIINNCDAIDNKESINVVFLNSDLAILTGYRRLSLKKSVVSLTKFFFTSGLPKNLIMIAYIKSVTGTVIIEQ